MKDKDLLITSAVVLLIALALYYAFKSNKNEKEKKEMQKIIDELQKENLQLYLSNPSFISQIQKSFIELLQLTDNEKYLKELTEAFEQININHKVFILKITKIIENLFEEEFKGKEDYSKFIEEFNKKPENKSQKLKSGTFNSYIEYAKHIDLIQNDDYYFLKIIKDYRNKEAHELSPEIEEKAKNIALSAVNLLKKLLKMRNKS